MQVVLASLSYFALNHAMAPFPWFDVFVICVLIMINGVFAMSELAIVSARSAVLQAAENNGSKGAATARVLASDPGKFLSTVQIGITLISILAGAYSGSSLGGPVGERLTLLGVPDDWAGTIGFGLVIAVTTYGSLVIGELVPKQLALRKAEPVAIIMAPVLAGLARVTAPLVWVLDRSSAVIFRMLGLQRYEQQMVTAEELHLIVAEATRSGVIEEHERQVIAGVVRLADRPVREIMTPRTEVDWIDVDSSPDEIRAKLQESPHSRIPVAEKSVDQIIGLVQARDIAAALFRRETLDLRVLMRPLTIVPDQIDAMDALTMLRESEVPMVMVQDEYGHFEGIVTPADLLSAIAGEFVSDQDEGAVPHVIERADGSLLVSGAMPIDALAERLGMRLPEDRDYATVAGHALATLRHLPEEGELFEDQDWVFEIVDMDGRKIDKLLVRAAG